MFHNISEDTFAFMLVNNFISHATIIDNINEISEIKRDVFCSYIYQINDLDILTKLFNKKCIPEFIIYDILDKQKINYLNLIVNNYDPLEINKYFNYSIQNDLIDNVKILLPVEEIKYNVFMIESLLFEIMKNNYSKNIAKYFYDNLPIFMNKEIKSSVLNYII